MTVQLRVKIDDITKTVRMPATASVHETCKQLQEIKATLASDPDGIVKYIYPLNVLSAGRDYNLFKFVAEDDPRGQWLKANKTLDSYELQSNVLYHVQPIAKTILGLGLVS